MAAAIFAVPELREVILEQKADLSAQRHGPGQVGQDTLQVRFVFFIAHIMSSEKIGPEKKGSDLFFESRYFQTMLTLTLPKHFNHPAGKYLTVAQQRYQGMSPSSSAIFRLSAATGQSSPWCPDGRYFFSISAFRFPRASDSRRVDAGTHAHGPRS